MHAKNRLLLMSLLAIGSAGIDDAFAQSTGWEDAGTAVVIALPIAAGGTSILRNDWHGAVELVVSSGLTFGTTYALKEIVREKRPDGSDFKSFPSGHAALAFGPALYLWRRYGWEYGVPAFAAASFVGASRIKADKHHWQDVAASAVIAFGWDHFIVSRYHHNDDLQFAVVAFQDGAHASLDYHW